MVSNLKKYLFWPISEIESFKLKRLWICILHKRNWVSSGFVRAGFNCTVLFSDCIVFISGRHMVWTHFVKFVRFTSRKKRLTETSTVIPELFKRTSQQFLSSFSCSFFSFPCSVFSSFFFTSIQQYYTLEKLPCIIIRVTFTWLSVCSENCWNLI